MKIVIDIGCARYGGDYSIERLVEEFKPNRLYGFDPNQGPDEYPRQPNPPDGPTGPTTATAVIIEKKAAWIYDGEVGFRSDGLNSWVTEAPDAPKVECFDLSEFIYELTRYTSEAPRIILKLDCEGSEYDLLRHLIKTGADKLLSLAWVEWHEPDRGRELIEKEIACEIQEWRW